MDYKDLIKIDVRWSWRLSRLETREERLPRLRRQAAERSRARKLEDQQRSLVG